MGYPLSTKLDSTLRYISGSGLYGIATSVLTDIANALANAAAAMSAATTAQSTANTAQSAANTTATNLTAHIGSGGSAHALASGSAAGFMSAAHYTRVAGVEDGAQVTSEARVRTALAAATAAVTLNNQRLGSVGDPSSAQDAATKAYVDAIITGLLVLKASVRAVATTNITRSGAQTVDGVVLQDGDRILHADGASEFNGIYVVDTGGPWTRATDADANADVTSGLFVLVTQGNTYANTGWVLTTPDPIVVDTTPLEFQRLSGPVLSSAKPLETTSFSNASAGVATTVSRSDHKHAHGELPPGIYHAVATTSIDGFMSAADKTKMNSLAAGSTVTLGRVTVDCILETPTLLSGTGSVSVDTAIKNDFQIILSGATTLDFSAFVSGRQGNITVKQDATGSRTLAWTVAGDSSPSGFTLLKDTGLSDLNPQTAANSVTQYAYSMFTLGGTNYLQLSKAPLG